MALDLDVFMAYVPPGKRRAEAKAEAKDDGGAKPDSLLATVSSYFRDQAFGAAKGEGLEVVYEEFVLANCELFEEDESAPVERAGHRIEHTELHNEYLRLFEKTLEFVLEANGATPAQFARECQDALARGAMPEGCDEWFVEAMLGALDFDQFYRIMVAAARKRKRK